MLVPLLLGGTAALLLCCGGGGAGLWYAYKRANPPLVFTAFTPGDGSCSVLMPGTPTDDSRALGDDPTTHEYRFWHDRKDMRFELVYRDYAPGSEQAKEIEQEFAQRIDRVGVGQGATVSKTPVKVSTLSGTDHVYKRNGKVIAIVRQLDAKGRQTARKVLLIAEGDDTPDEDRSKFLNSYKQLKPLK